MKKEKRHELTNTRNVLYMMRWDYLCQLIFRKTVVFVGCICIFVVIIDTERLCEVPP